MRMLFLIGLGMCDGTDITMRGRALVQQSQHVYLEGYTSLLRCSHEELERELGAKIMHLSRTDVEQDIDKVIEQARNANVSLLVIGDVFGATTHTDLFLRAANKGVKTQIVHNASILTAVGASGLSLYKFGRTVSIPYWQKGFEPTSFVDGIAQNLAVGLHTLCLLDIKADEGRFMTIAQAVELLMRAQQVHSGSAISEHTRAVGVARIGWPEQAIIPGTLGELLHASTGSPPHALIILGKLNAVEEEMLEYWKNTTKQ